MACENTMECTCTYPCSKHGKCCQCIAYHKRMGEVPGCLFSKEGEATYDRTIEAVYQDYIRNK